jgi:hypothetical protein
MPSRALCKRLGVGIGDEHLPESLSLKNFNRWRIRCGSILSKISSNRRMGRFPAALLRKVELRQFQSDEVGLLLPL